MAGDSYPVTDQEKEDIARRFTYHKPKDNQPERYEKLRNKAKELAMLYLELSPKSREQSLGLTYLEISIMEINAAIARNE